MDRATVRTLMSANGIPLHASNRVTDWFTCRGEAAAFRFYDLRESLPFVSLFCHDKDGGIVVYYDRAKDSSDPTESIKQDLRDKIADRIEEGWIDHEHGGRATRQEIANAVRAGRADSR